MIKYRIYENNGVVRADIENCRRDAINRVAGLECRVSLLMPKAFSGIAKVKNGDTFDTERGRACARDIILKKHQKSLEAALDRYEKYLLDIADKVVLLRKLLEQNIIKLLRDGDER